MEAPISSAPAATVATLRETSSADDGDDAGLGGGLLRRGRDLRRGRRQLLRRRRHRVRGADDRGHDLAQRGRPRCRARRPSGPSRPGSCRPLLRVRSPLARASVTSRTLRVARATPVATRKPRPRASGDAGGDDGDRQHALRLVGALRLGDERPPPRPPRCSAVLDVRRSRPRTPRVAPSSGAATNSAPLLMLRASGIRSLSRCDCASVVDLRRRTRRGPPRGRSCRWPCTWRTARRARRPRW